MYQNKLAIVKQKRIKIYNNIYNHKTTSFAIYSKVAHKYKMLKAKNRQAIIVNQVHGKMYKKLYLNILISMRQ